MFTQMKKYLYEPVLYVSPFHFLCTLAVEKFRFVYVYIVHVFVKIVKTKNFILLPAILIATNGVSPYRHESLGKAYHPARDRRSRNRMIQNGNTVHKRGCVTL